MKQTSLPKKQRAVKIISIVVFLSFLVPVIFLLFRIATYSPESNPTDRTRSEYVLMLVQCLLGILAMILPSMITKRLRLEIPSIMYLMFLIFLYCAIFLGEVQNFYYIVPHWDTILHTFSGAMLGALGFSFISLLNKEKKVSMLLSPVFVAIFAFSFAVTLGALWEIYEFSFDGILGLNMQKFALEDGVPLVGRAALADTMKDIIVDCLGALAASLIGYFAIKFKKGWFDDLLIIRENEATTQKTEK